MFIGRVDCDDLNIRVGKKSTWLDLNSLKSRLDPHMRL